MFCEDRIIRRIRTITFIGIVLSGLLTKLATAQTPVRVEPVSTRPIVQYVNITGSVTSPRTALLSTAVAGLVADLTVDEGHRVKQGDALLALDMELAVLALERFLAEVRQRETELADAKRRLKDAEKIGANSAISRSEIESLRAEVMADDAALAASQAAAREQQAIVERHTIRAPFDGVISQRLTELGEWINRGDGLFELVATDNLRFDFRVAQDYFADLTPETPVEIALDAFPDRMMAGKVDSIVPVKNPSARTFLVRVLTQNVAADAASQITPGMSVRGRLALDVGRQGVAVSRDAILRFPDGRVTVWLVKETDGRPTVQEQAVQTGLEFNGMVEIRDGLKEGDIVVTRGNEILRDGEVVTILTGES